MRLDEAVSEPSRRLRREMARLDRHRRGVVSRRRLLTGEKGRSARRAVPIHAYVGPNGGGKTLAMIHDTLPSLGLAWECGEPTHRHTREGVTSGVRTVLSTVQLYDRMGEPHPLCTILTSWRQMLDAEHCDILLDEVTGVANSRSSATMPVQLLNMLVQLRKRDCILRYTTPNWARTDVCLREVTQAVTVCKGFLWQEVPGSLWPSKRLFYYRTYDAVEWEDFSLEKVADVRPLAKSWYWRPGRDAMYSYDTKSSVSTLDHLDLSGLCVNCGGKRAPHKCVCPAGAGCEGAPAPEPPLSNHVAATTGVGV